MEVAVPEMLDESSPVQLMIPPELMNFLTRISFTELSISDSVMSRSFLILLRWRRGFVRSSSLKTGGDFDIGDADWQDEGTRTCEGGVTLASFKDR